jgi:hypothetical protein
MLVNEYIGLGLLERADDKCGQPSLYIIKLDKN